MKELEIYKNKKVLITGHTGFKGSWLTIWLKMLGARVTGYSIGPSYDNGIYKSAGLSKLINDYQEDIRDFKTLKDVIVKENIEFVFHMAAQSLVLDGYKQPLYTFDTNIMGAVNILESIRITDTVKAGVIITSDKCYENKEKIYGYKEDDPMGGHDPYSASKGAAEIVVKAYINSFFSSEKHKGIASARAGNVIGGGDWSSNRLIPDIFKALLSQKEIQIRNPDAIRPWQHVLEVLHGYLLLGAKLYKSPKEYEGSWNFGPYMDDIFSVNEIADMILNIFGSGTKKINKNINAKHEATLLMLDNKKAVNLLKWRPSLTMNERVTLTSNWYQQVNSKNIYDLTIDQIKEYETLWRLKNTK